MNAGESTMDPNSNVTLVFKASDCLYTCMQFWMLNVFEGEGVITLDYHTQLHRGKNVGPLLSVPSLEDIGSQSELTTNVFSSQLLIDEKWTLNFFDKDLYNNCCFLSFPLLAALRLVLLLKSTLPIFVVVVAVVVVVVVIVVVCIL